MTNRYKETLTINDEENSPRYYETALTSDKPATTLALTHRVRFGERFDTIAYKYYGTATLWWYVAKANGYVDGSITAPPGTILTIPRLTV